MVMKIDENELIRTACEQLLAEHIQTRLVCMGGAGASLQRGSVIGQAKWIASGWTHAQARLFYLLASSMRKTVATRSLADAAGMSFEEAKTFVGNLKSQRRYEVRGVVADTKQDFVARLFRSGSELKWDGDGIMLVLNARLIDFAAARKIADDTRATYVAVKANHEGAIAAQEADVSKPDEERTRSRADTTAAVDRALAPADKLQADLFRTGTGE